MDFVFFITHFLKRSWGNSFKTALIHRIFSQIVGVSVRSGSAPNA